MQRRQCQSLIYVVLVCALARAHGQTPGQDKFSATQARLDFRLYCADCHGEDGRGQGPKAYGLGGALPDLTALRERNHGTFPRERLVQIIDGRDYIQAHGTREMPAWGRWLKMEAAEGLGGVDGDERVVRQRIRELVDLLDQWQR